MKLQSPRHFLRADRGVAAIETAFILPFLLFLYFGMVDLTNFVSLNRRVTQATNTMADMISQEKNSVQKSAITAWGKIAPLILKPIPDGDISYQISGNRINAGGAVEQYWEVKKGAFDCGGIPTAAALKDLMTSTNAGVVTVNNEVMVARLCTKFRPFMSTFLGTKWMEVQYTVSETISLRPRATAKLECHTATPETVANLCS